MMQDVWMATAKKNTDIYDEVRCDFDAKLFVKTAYLALLTVVLKFFTGNMVL